MALAAIPRKYDVGVAGKSSYENLDGALGSGNVIVQTSDAIAVNQREGIRLNTSSTSISSVLAAGEISLKPTGNSYITGSKLGIGKIDPTTELDVAGTVAATSFVGDGYGLSGIPAPIVFQAWVPSALNQ